MAWRIAPIRAAEAAALLAAAACAVAPVPATTIERWYSLGFYPHVQRALTSVSNQLPVALLDVLLVVVVAGVARRLWMGVRRAWRTGRVQPVAVALVDVAALGAVLYVTFLLVWGLNYRRVAMVDRVELLGGAPSADAVVQLGLESARAMNRLYAEAHASPDRGPEWKDADLRRAFSETQRALSDAAGAEPGRLKHSLLGPYFRWAGVDGMVNPFGLEVIANPDLLAFERPFVAAHEWSHLAGFADEADANFVGWLTCVRAAAPAQYSGWLYLFWQVRGEVDEAGQSALTAALDEGPRRDVAAVTSRLRRGEVRVLQQASWRVYDSYLKANRVASGVRSYGAVVTLLLRARFEPGWTPVRRQP